MDGQYDDQVRLRGLRADSTYQYIDGHGGPDLCFHRILRSAVKRLDKQMLFDPFEEQFDLPTAAIQLVNRVCGQGKIVDKEHQLLAGFRVGHLDSAEFVRIVLGGVEAGEDDGLVALSAQ